MEQFISAVEWGLFLQTAFWLFIVYVIIRNLPLIFRMLGGGDNTHRWLTRVGGSVRIAFELVALVILLVLFLRINLITNSLIVGILLIVAWTPARNFLNGSYIRLSTSLSVGQKIAFKGDEAIVKSIGAFGVTLQMSAGTRIVEYRLLRKHGLTLVSGMQLSNFLELTVTPDENKEEEKLPLKQLMLTCPYLDWSYLPEVKPNDTLPASVDLKVFLIDEKYTQGFISLVNEWGYSVVRPTNS